MKCHKLICKKRENIIPDKAGLRVAIKAEGQRAAAACCLRNAWSKVF
jgi:hypothetical protein